MTSSMSAVETTPLAQDALTAWHAAERRMNELMPGSPSADAMAEQIDDLRRAYERAVEFAERMRSTAVRAPGE
ncbi:MAG: hypothetical protein ABI766_14550 [Gemmatimonadales bacterium]